METGERRFFYPLTSLQIGDLQSYLSCRTIFLAPRSKKFFILVDYRLCLTDWDMRPTHLWQLMITKSRLSPFANRKVQRQKKSFPKRLDSKNGTKSDKDNNKMLRRWFSLIGAALNQKRAFLPIEKLKDSFVRNSDLHDTFYGFIIFEISWSDVRGINYVNELLTDTSMAVEAKIMKRWEFDSVQQASSSISSWFAGTRYERSLLLNFLNDGSKTGEPGDIFFDAHENTSAIGLRRDCIPSSDDDDLAENRSPRDDASSSSSDSSETLLYTPPISGSFKRRKLTGSTFIINDGDEVSDKAASETISSPRQSPASTSHFSSDSESASTVPEATNYQDVLILFRFNDHDLPFKLKEIIMADRRLLTLLEYGLPSWVIFLQSYPVFCNIYRPWMCPLARILYIFISAATVLIGFYDLYKNIPVLKATASRLCGPFFNWIESWEMISRIRYLGTMLFLHNFEIAVGWFVVTSRAIRSIFSVLSKPLAGPLMELMDLLAPFRVLCLEMTGFLTSVTWNVIGSTCSMVMTAVNLLLWPFWLVLSLTWSLATSVMYPIVWILWGVLIAPARLIFACVNLMVMLYSSACGMMGGVWSMVAPVFQIMPRSEVTVRSFEIPLWRSLCLKVFHAIKGILYGFIAFFATCNRHRLSISNRLQEIALGHSTARGGALDSGHHPLKKSRARTPVSQRGRAHSRHHPDSSSEKTLRRRTGKNREVLVDE